MDTASFKDIAAGIQSLGIAVGVIIGGIWTVYTFRRLGLEHKADVELNALKMAQQPILELSIRARSPVRQDEDSGFALLIELQLKNTGRKYIIVDTSRPLITVAHLDLPVASEPVLSQQPIHLTSFYLERDKRGERTSRYLRPGDVRHLAFATSVSASGVYLIQGLVHYGEWRNESGDYYTFAVEQALIEIPSPGRKGSDA